MKKTPRKSRDDIQAIADYEPYIPHSSWEYDQINGALKPLDALSNELEISWGVDKLITLVSPETAAKFEAAKQKLNVAILDHNVEEVIRRSGVLMRGYKALETEALAAGYKPLPPDLWHCHAEKDADNQEFSLVIAKDASAATLAQTDLPVYTVAEIARIVRAWNGQLLIHAAKKVFPDAELVKLTGDDMFDDDVPF